MSRFGIVWVVFFVAVGGFSGLASGADLVGYKAAYALSLAREDDAGAIIDVRGKATMSFEKTCSGWVSEEAWLMDITRGDGSDFLQRTTSSFWESLDGRKYRFSGRNSLGEESEVIQGQAERASGGARAVFDRPEKRTFTLPSDVLFPAAHTMKLVAHAEAGDRLFSSTVFSGSDIDSGQRFEAFISKPFPVQKDVDGVASDVLSRPGWNVHIGVYAPQSTSAEPLYSLGIRLLDNGVPAHVVLEYPTFSINLKLIEIHGLPSPAC